MPLIKQTLESKLKTRIKALEPKLYNALKSKTQGLYKAQLIVDQKISDKQPASGFDIYKYKNKLWQANADEWGKVLAKEIIKILSDDIPEIIADEMTTYIKSATIISPAGQTSSPAAVGAPVTIVTPAAPSKIT